MDKPVVKNKYYALRHGFSEKNELGLVVSYPEKRPYHLTQKGIEQVKEGSLWLRSEHIDCIYASDLTRTRESAKIASEIIDNGVSVVFDERLREIDFGVFNGKTQDEWRAFFDDYQNVSERFVKRPDGGENYADVAKRMSDFLYDVEQNNDNRHILLVSHGIPLWLLQWVSWCVTGDELNNVPYPETGKAVKLDVRCPPYKQNNMITREH